MQSNDNPSYQSRSGAAVSSIGSSTVTNSSASVLDPITTILDQQPISENISFQYTLAHITKTGTVAGGASQTITHDPATNARIQTLSAQFAKAQFTHLELVVVPQAPMIQGAMTLGLVWGHSGLIPTTANLMSIPSATLHTFGGAFNLGSEFILQCPLDAINSIFKDSVTRNYQPRLSYYASSIFMAAGGSAPPDGFPCIDLVIRGSFTHQSNLMAVWQ